MMLWKLNNIEKYGRRDFRVNTISLEIKNGITAVLGYSGAGKTSLLNLLVGFEDPDAGSVACAIEQDLFALPYYWVPQNYGLWPDATVEQHLCMVNKSLDSHRIDALLAPLDIVHKKQSKPAELSHGECARLSVARAMACNAAVLVMDEPFSHVDPSRKGRYWRFLIDYIRSKNSSLVFSSHIPENVIADAEHVVCLKSGTMIYEGSVDVLYRQPESKELAECLGETNWFEKDEDLIWIHGLDTPISIRPEQLRVKEVEKSDFIVESVYFQGMVSEVEIRHVSTGSRRCFYCSLPHNSIKVKGYVELELD